jgi:hypothetical protein
LGLVRRFKSSREKLLSLRRLAEAQAATPERDELLGELDDIIRTL